MVFDSPDVKFLNHLVRKLLSVFEIEESHFAVIRIFINLRNDIFSEVQVSHHSETVPVFRDSSHSLPEHLPRMEPFEGLSVKGNLT